LHFRTVSPFGYERLSKFLHSVRMGMPLMLRRTRTSVPRTQRRSYVAE
jgi:hypothetical protein